MLKRIRFTVFVLPYAVPVVNRFTVSNGPAQNGYGFLRGVGIVFDDYYPFVYGKTVNGGFSGPLTAEPLRGSR